MYRKKSAVDGGPEKRKPLLSASGKGGRELPAVKGKQKDSFGQVVDLSHRRKKKKIRPDHLRKRREG